MKMKYESKVFSPLRAALASIPSLFLAVWVFINANSIFAVSCAPGVLFCGLFQAMAASFLTALASSYLIMKALRVRYALATALVATLIVILIPGSARLILKWGSTGPAYLVTAAILPVLVFGLTNYVAVIGMGKREPKSVR